MRSELLLLLLSLAAVKTEINQISALKYENYTIPSMDFVCFNTTITANISEKCGEQLNVVCANTTLLLTMLDATSKFPYSGINYETRMDLGNYDECLTIDHKYESGRILGKHCAAGFLIPDILGNATDASSIFILSICKPDACTAEDYTSMIGQLGLPFLFMDDYCVTVDTGKELTASDVVTIIIFATIILLMIISTAYDFYLEKMHSESSHPLYVAFSMLSNGRKLLHISRNSKEQIQTFHGLRAISMMWIVAGHTYQVLQYFPLMNTPAITKWQNSRYAGYITTAPLSVDTFFFISGFLLAYQYLKQKVRPLKNQIMSIPQLVLYRYIRLTPALFMIFLVIISILKHLGDGPLWNIGAKGGAKTCTDHWWPLLLYLQNWLVKDAADMCLPQTWYLAADMQMFILSPLILIPLSLNVRKPSGFKMSMVALLILNLFFIALPMALLLLDRDYRHDRHFYSRLINYYIGVMLAVFMRIKQDKPFLYMMKISNKSVINLLVWIVILLGMITILVCYREVEMNHGYDSNAVFQSLMRPGWCIGLSWIVYSSYHGYGGIVNWILSGPIMQVIGRLTYCIYLIHFTVMELYNNTARSKVYFSDYSAFYTWCGHFTMSTIIAIFWTLAFESPLIIIEKHFFGRGHVQSKPAQPVIEDPETNEKNIQ